MNKLPCRDEVAIVVVNDDSPQIGISAAVSATRHEQFNVLRILRGSHPKALMLAEITARMIDKSSNCTRLVEKLRQKDFVKRVICENNRRQVDISITEKGLALLKRIDASNSNWANLVEKISKTEAKELNRILDKLRE